MVNIRDFVTFPFNDMKLYDFIGLWQGKVPEELCDQLVEYIETQDLNPPMGMKDTTIREDAACFLLENREEDQEMYHHIVDSYLEPAKFEYLSNFGSLKGIVLKSSEIKLQKTKPCQGYHLWHCERGGLSFVMRELVWSIYLNDMPDGEGETEFIYQKFRYKPRKGDILIWPAGFTHTHRGNPPYTKDKYIATGWFLNVAPGGMHCKDKDGNMQKVKVTTITDEDARLDREKREQDGI